MAKAADAFVEFEGDFSKINRGVGAQSKRLESTFNSSFKRIATFAAGALAAIGVGKVLTDAFAEAQEAQTIAKQTRAVIKSTGGAARVSARDVDRLATSLSNVAGIDDEVIAGGENVLLTFTNVRNEVGKGNDVFDQAATAAVNLSSALGTDLQGSVIQIGKALNDPIKGVTALQRVGVSFTKQQKDQIKTLVESGKTLEAQKLILRELTTEFGGAAEAAATPAQKLSVAVKNIEESLGLLFLPAVQKVASFLSERIGPAIEDLIPKLRELGGFAKFAFQIGFGQQNIAGIKGWLSIFARLGAVIRGFVDFFRGDVVHAGIDIGRAFGLDDQSPTITKLIKTLVVVRKALVAVIDFVAKHWRPILGAAVVAVGLLVSPVLTVAAGLIFLYIRFKFVRDIVAGFIGAIRAVDKFLRRIKWDEIFRRIADDATNVGHVFRDVWRTIGPTVKAAFDTIVAVVRPILAIIIFQIRTTVAVITDLWDRFGRTILDKIRIAFNAVVTIIKGAFQVLQGIFEIITGILTLKWSKAWEGLQDVVAGAWKAVLGIAQFAINQLSSVIAVGMGLISAAWGAVWDGLKFVAGGALSAVVGFFQSLPGRILAFVGAVGSAALAIGKAIIDGLIKGIKGAVGFVSDIGKAIANAGIGFINRVIDKINDALEFKVHGPGFLPDISVNPPDIPHISPLAHGAVVSTPMLALLGEDARTTPEIVSPVKLMAETFRKELAGLTGRQRVTNFNIQQMQAFDTDELVRKLATRQRHEELLEAF